MANTAHASLTGANLHEPKGVASANNGEVYVADGAGSGTWIEVPPHGSTATNLIGGTPYSLAATTSYQKVAATTTASGHPSDMTEGTDAKLTYTGDHDVHMDIIVSVSIKQASGSGKDVTFALYQNGLIVSDAEFIASTTTAEYKTISIHADVIASQNDYFEIYAKINSAATIDFYVVKLHAAARGF